MKWFCRADVEHSHPRGFFVTVVLKFAYKLNLAVYIVRLNDIIYIKLPEWQKNHLNLLHKPN